MQLDAFRSFVQFLQYKVIIIMKNFVYIALFISAVVLLACNSKGKNMVRLTTTHGVIEMKLYDETPKHRDNFISLVEQSYFDSLLFHRVIKGFVIQAGDPDSKNAPADMRLGEGGPDYLIDAEILSPQIFHKRGVLAAARKGDSMNPEKKSSGSQFYIAWGAVYSMEQLEAMQRVVERSMGRKMEYTPQQIEAYTTVGGIPFLDGEYTVFGEVTKGLEVVDSIQNVECDRYDRPCEDVRIIKAEIID